MGIKWHRQLNKNWGFCSGGKVLKRFLSHFFCAIFLAKLEPCSPGQRRALEGLRQEHRGARGRTLISLWQITPLPPQHQPPTPLSSLVFHLGNARPPLLSDKTTSPDWSFHRQIKCDHLANTPCMGRWLWLTCKKRIMIIICKIIAHTKWLHDPYINHT